MKEGERNVIIINICNSLNLKEKLLKLKRLDKIDDVILVENNLKEYLKNLMVRILIFPFKKKSDYVIFYLDGFVGYYPLHLANIGLPDEVNFYEEGESIYQKDVLFKKERKVDLKQSFNECIKKVLFIKKNSILHIKKFYVRDKNRLLRTLKNNSFFDSIFEIIEIDDVAGIRELSSNDKDVLKNIFFENFTCDFSLRCDERSAIVLTQPIYFHGEYTKIESVNLFNCYIKRLKQEDYKVYLKLHPKEQEDLYLTEGVQRINGQFPFELLALYGVEFEKGLTYNSTAIQSSIIKNKFLIEDDLKKKTL
ncbi:polysialyltransferase family glycosyltransferase [Buttiauxella gaviniae]|uniref:polysialyltransferase family glycosyltransferase n=1 Tax=Buttiauxella gaviniae TaxID=82990 RepID=UPI0039754AA3